MEDGSGELVLSEKGAKERASGLGSYGHSQTFRRWNVAEGRLPRLWDRCVSLIHVVEMFDGMSRRGSTLGRKMGNRIQREDSDWKVSYGLLQIAVA